MCSVLEIANPFIDEVGRHVLNAQPEHIVHLCRENSKSNTAGKANNHWVWYKFNHIAELENSD